LHSSFLFISDLSYQAFSLNAQYQKITPPAPLRRFADSACTASAEGLPPSILQHWSPSLFELINGLGFHSGHTIEDNVQAYLTEAPFIRRLWHDHAMLLAVLFSSFVFFNLSVLFVQTQKLQSTSKPSDEIKTKTP